MWDTPTDPDAPSVFPAPRSAAEVTAAVTFPVPAPTALPELPLSDTLIALLAREVAMDINEIVTIIAHFGLTPEQFEAVQKNPFYIKVLEQERVAWSSATNTEQRLRLKAQTLLEEALPELGARMMKRTEALPAVAETGKLMARIAGIGEKAPTADRGEKFSINIQIGDTSVTKDVTPKVLALSAAEPSGA